MAEGAFFAIYYYILIVIVVVTYIYYRSNSRVVCYGTEVDETVAEEGVYENIVSQELPKLSVEYITFNNLLFCGQRGTVQIDHLAISPYGIFVIEKKGHRG